MKIELKDCPEKLRDAVFDRIDESNDDPAVLLMVKKTGVPAYRDIEPYTRYKAILYGCYKFVSLRCNVRHGEADEVRAKTITSAEILDILECAPNETRLPRPKEREPNG